MKAEEAPQKPPQFFLAVEEQRRCNMPDKKECPFSILTDKDSCDESCEFYSKKHGGCIIKELPAYLAAMCIIIGHLARLARITEEMAKDLKSLVETLKKEGGCQDGGYG